MKIKELFEYVDEVMENVFSDKVKLRWLNQIEAELQVDVLLLQTEGIVQYTMEDLEKALIAPPPFDELYAEYLQYRICLAQEEPERANNKVATFNRAYHEYARFVAETANPGDGMAELRRYYLRGEPGKQGEQGIQGERGDPGLTMEYDEETETLIIDIAPSTGSSGSDGDGEDSETGTNTVGITSIEQTVTSKEDGGVNEVTVTMSDGTTSVFQIRNGSKGSVGRAGISVVAIGYDAQIGKWYWEADDELFTRYYFEGPSVYTKDEIDTKFDTYVTEVAALLGGDA